jgi:DNA-nicking Smr family endonuclease
VTGAAFHVEWQGEQVRGWADGIDRAHLRRLRRGEIEPELELDLHGLREDEAARSVASLIAEAVADGVRCIGLIHGRGHRSEDGPVLKGACVRWLSEEPLAARVMAFHSAPAAEGGTGATWVLLRRTRS